MKPIKTIPSQAELRLALDYDQEAGVFRWRSRQGMPAQWNVRYPGTVAGRIGSKGHIEIMVNKVRYAAHRLAWVWVHGVDPGPQVDHEDLVKTNNSIKNLRPATNSQNHANSTGWKGRTLPKGVYRTRQIENHFRAQICHQGKQRHLGVFRTIDEASNAYRAAAVTAFGDFARFG